MKKFGNGNLNYIPSTIKTTVGSFQAQKKKLRLDNLDDKKGNDSFGKIHNMTTLVVQCVQFVIHCISVILNIFGICCLRRQRLNQGAGRHAEGHNLLMMNIAAIEIVKVRRLCGSFSQVRQLSVTRSIRLLISKIS